MVTCDALRPCLTSCRQRTPGHSSGRLPLDGTLRPSARPTCRLVFTTTRPFDTFATFAFRPYSPGKQIRSPAGDQLVCMEPSRLSRIAFHPCCSIHSPIHSVRAPRCPWSHGTCPGITPGRTQMKRTRSGGAFENAIRRAESCFCFWRSLISREFPRGVCAASS